MADIHPSRSFLHVSKLHAMLRNMGCRQLEMSSIGCTIWRAPNGVPFNLMDPDVEINGEMTGYSGKYMLELQERLIVTMSGDDGEDHDGVKIGHAGPKKKH